MENINIKINKKTRQVNLSKSVIGNDGENLQEKLVFEFDEFVNGTARLELIKQGETASYIMLTKVDETYELPIKSVITKAGKLNMQLVITEGTDDEEIPIFKSNQFYVIVNSSINAEIEEPEEYPQWIDVANTKLNEIDNLDIDAEKVDHTTTITITKKDGTEKTTEVNDGIDGTGLDYNWSGTSLGIKREDETNYQYVNLQGPQGAPGSIRMVIVNTLPETGEEGTLYFVPKTPDTSDLYDEYVWINNAWELLGEKQITVDLSDYYTKQETYSQAEVNALIPSLTDYVKNTDYATNTNAGVIIVQSGWGVRTSYGYLVGNTFDYPTYQNSNNAIILAKGTLENVITGKQLVNQTYVDNLVGDIASAIDLISGESV